MCILHRGALVVQGRVRELLSRDRLTVRITTTDNNAAHGVLSSLPWVDDLAVEEDTLQCTVPPERLAETNAALVGAGVGVSAFAPRRSLEDYFLSITEQDEVR
jgi:hypothetical protein